MRYLSLLLAAVTFLFPVADAQFAARTQFFTAPQSPTYDADAAAWIAAVETADGAALETGVKTAMNQLVLDLKANSLWTPIQTMVVKMGARTLSGALIDIKNPGSSWTNNNFVSGDYNRTTGLIGNASNKYLDSGRANSADNRNNSAKWTYVTTLATGLNYYYMSSGAGVTGGDAFRRASATLLDCWSRSSTASSNVSANALGLIGINRDNGSNFVSSGGGTSETNTCASQAPNALNTFEYANNNAGSPNVFSNHRSCAAAIGAAHNLATAESVMDTFIASITALGL